MCRLWYFEHEFIFLRKESNGTEDEFEELEVEVRLFHVVSHGVHALRGEE